MAGFHFGGALEGVRVELKYYLLQDAATKFGISESLLLHYGARGELPIYIDGNEFTFELGWCGDHSFHHLSFVAVRYPDFIQIAPAFLESIRKNGAALLGGTTSCLIPAGAKKHLEYLLDYNHPQEGKIPDSDLELILSDQPISGRPRGLGGFYYAGKTHSPPQINRVELDLFVLADDLEKIANTNARASAKPRTPDSKKYLDIREKNNLLRIIKVLALELEIDISVPHKAAGIIQVLAERHGVEVPKKPDTIAKKIAEARDA